MEEDQTCKEQFRKKLHDQFISGGVVNHIQCILTWAMDIHKPWNFAHESNLQCTVVKQLVHTVESQFLELPGSRKQDSTVYCLEYM